MSQRNGEDGTDLVEPLIDLQRITSGIRWRRRIWLTLALVGLLLGVASAVVLPTRATAVTRIYVVHQEEGGDGETAMKTDLALLETTTVASAALDRLKIDLPPERFVAEYSGDIVAANILEITARGADNAQALSRAQAVADGFIAVHVKQGDDAATAEAKALTDRQAQVQRDLDEVDAQIAAAGQPLDPARAKALIDRRSSLSSQINDLGQRAEDAALGSPRVAAGTKIIDTPRVTSRALIVSILLIGAVGMFLGLVVGIAVAAVITIARDRPVLRRDISANLGASVIAQLPAPPGFPKRLWKRSRAEEERRHLAATIARMVRDGDGPVSLLELGCPDVVVTLARDVVTELAGQHPVVVVDDLPGRDLREAEAADAGSDGGPVVIDGADFPADPPADPQPDERRLAVASVGPGTPWTDLRRLGQESVLVVRAGSAETTWMHTVARQLADSGIAIIGVVVVHPDPRDRSDGTLWNALHTALRGRGLSIPEPEPAPQAPLVAQPQPSFGPQPMYGPPVYGQQPMYGRPVYGPPAYGPQPVYGRPPMPVTGTVAPPPVPAPAQAPAGDATPVVPAPRLPVTIHESPTETISKVRPADVSNGAASNGAASNGAASNGAASNGAASNGAASNGAASNGAASNGADGTDAGGNGAATEGAATDNASHPAEKPRRRPSPRPIGMSSQGDARPRPRPRPRSTVDIDGHPTTKLTKVVPQKQADHEETT